MFLTVCRVVDVVLMVVTLQEKECYWLKSKLALRVRVNDVLGMGIWDRTEAIDVVESEEWEIASVS